MRESNNLNMIPLPCDNMNILIGAKNFLTNVSSNGYYGYQSQHQVPIKEFSEAYPEPQATKGNENNPVKMEIQYSFQESCDMQIENDTRDESRKRRCCSEEMRDFKKRRQHERIISKQNDADDTTNLTSDEQMKTSALHQKAVPRCMMDYNRLDIHHKQNKEQRELEDILRETHGVNMYHWLQNED